MVLPLEVTFPCNLLLIDWKRAAIKREVLSVLAEGVATAETIDSMWVEQYADKRFGPW